MSGATVHAAAPELTPTRGEVRGHSTCDSAGAPLDREVRSEAARHVTVLKPTHRQRVRSGATEHVAARGYTSCSSPLT
jgi:hypothetical protein